MMIPHAKTWSVITQHVIMTRRSEKDVLLVTDRSGTQHDADNVPFDM
jgi:hypothetical protein